jgi:hypothetical protein
MQESSLQLWPGRPAYASSPNGEGGIRISKKPAGKTRVSRKGGTESGTESRKTASDDESALALAWDQLPEETRQRLASLTPEMLAVLRSVFGGAPGPPH